LRIAYRNHRSSSFAVQFTKEAIATHYSAYANSIKAWVFFILCTEPAKGYAKAAFTTTKCFAKQQLSYM
jgi:hypothetical protein